MGDRENKRKRAWRDECQALWSSRILLKLNKDHQLLLLVDCFGNIKFDFDTLRTIAIGNYF